MVMMKSRVPVIALSYSDKHKAVPKELLVDYETGNIYVVSATDKSVIFNVTEQIKEQLDKVSGDKIEVNIDGIGIINLTELLTKITKESITVKDVGKADVYIPRKERIDGVSIQSVYKRIQIAGFDTAESGMIPQKYVDGIRWIYPPQQPEGGGSNPGDPSIPNPEDGFDTKVHVIEPVNGKLYLRASKRQKTNNLHEDIRLILPRTLDNFCEIFWCVKTYSYRPNITFAGNTLFSTENQPNPDAYQVYRFSTWDAGETWFGTLTIYDNSSNSVPGLNEPIDLEYLKAHYYNKTEIDSRYLDKDEIDYEYVSKQFMKDKYFTKEDIKEGYFTKDKVEELVSWRNSGGVRENQIELPSYLLNR